MTIIRQDYFIEYAITTGESERVEFPFEFPLKEAEQIYCFDIAPNGDATEIAASGFLVTPASGGFKDGGAATFALPFAVGHALRIERVTPKTQLKVFTNQAAIPPEEVEDGLDRLTMALQEAAGNTGGGTDPSVIAEIEAQMADLQTNKAGLDQLNAGLAQKSSLIHASRHAAGGADPISPESIQAVPQSFVEQADPFPQYQLRGGDQKADLFFDFDPVTGGIVMKAAVADGVQSDYFVLVAGGGVMLREFIER